MRDVVAERVRQVEQEGWTAEHDDAHDLAELAEAAACYAHHAAFRIANEDGLDANALKEWMTMVPLIDCRPTEELKLMVDAIERLYGRGAFMRPRDGERWSGNGHTFQGYVDVYRSIPRSTSDELVAEHIWISV